MSIGRGSARIVRSRGMKRRSGPSLLMVMMAVRRAVMVASGRGVGLVMIGRRRGLVRRQVAGALSVVAVAVGRHDVKVGRHGMRGNRLCDCEGRRCRGVQRSSRVSRGRRLLAGVLVVVVALVVLVVVVMLATLVLRVRVVRMMRIALVMMGKVGRRCGRRRG